MIYWSIFYNIILSLFMCTTMPHIDMAWGWRWSKPSLSNYAKVIQIGIVTKCLAFTGSWHVGIANNVKRAVQVYLVSATINTTRQHLRRQCLYISIKYYIITWINKFTNLIIQSDSSNIFFTLKINQFKFRLLGTSNIIIFLNYTR